jgi:hypothetical protein
MRRVLELLLALLSIVVAYGCGGDDEGCQADLDCREPRICVQGQCVYPDEGGGGNASAACTVDSHCKSPRICVEGRCVLPDEGGGGNAGSSTLPTAVSPCAELCEIVEALSCPAENPATCISDCNQLWNLEPCNREIRALLDCFARQAQDSWECNADSMEAETKPGLCEVENAAFVSCNAA